MTIRGGTLGIPPQETVFGDVVLLNEDTGEITIASRKDIPIYDNGPYDGLGIIVVPGTHDVYGDGSCGIISRVEMSAEKPDIGTADTEEIYFGDSARFFGSTNYDSVSIYENQEDGSVATALFGYLPSEAFDGELCNKNKDLHYKRNITIDNSTNGLIPTPILDGGSKNPDYSSGTTNALSDFDGRFNTGRIIENESYQPDWKTDDTIRNLHAGGHYPAACCCWRYNVGPTMQGDWYLPAIGELGYVVPYIDTINDIIYELSDLRYQASVYVNKNNYYISSTESHIETNMIWDISMEYGCVTNGDKNNAYSTRAFMRIGPNGIVRD